MSNQNTLMWVVIAGFLLPFILQLIFHKKKLFLCSNRPFDILIGVFALISLVWFLVAKLVPCMYSTPLDLTLAIAAVARGASYIIQSIRLRLRSNKSERDLKSVP